MRTILLGLTLVAAACASPVGPGDAVILPLDDKEDVATRVDVGRIDIFRMQCALASCPVQLWVSGLLGLGSDDATVVLALGSIDQMRALRTDALYSDPRPSTGDTILTELSRADLERGVWLDVAAPTGETYGILYSRDAEIVGELSVRYRILAAQNPADPLPTSSEGVYEASRETPDALRVDRWFIPVDDVLDWLPAPTIRLRVEGLVNVAVYYVCDADGSSHAIPVDTWYENDITPSCLNTSDETGRLIIEVAYERDYHIWASLD